VCASKRLCAGAFARSSAHAPGRPFVPLASSDFRFVLDQTFPMVRNPYDGQPMFRVLGEKTPYNEMFSEG
jgi:hypothetical protein